jgi:AsmA protein
MKKVIWICGVLSALIVIVLLGLSLFVKSYLKDEKLRSFIIPKAEEMTGRKVGIDRINVSVFRGIVVKGISIKEYDGSRDFLTIKEVVLEYSLWPLLKRQLIIKKVEVLSPYISVKRERDGRYNFDDITERVSKGAKGQSGAEADKREGLPFTITTDRIEIKDVKVDFVDVSKEIPDIATKADIELKASGGKVLKEIKVAGQINLRELRAVAGGLQTNTSGKIDLNSDSISINLDSTVGKDRIKISGTVKDYATSPDIRLNLSSKVLNLDAFMVPGGAKRTHSETVKGKGEKIPGKDSPAQKMKASGEIRIDTAVYKNYTIKNFHVDYHYADGLMKIEPVKMDFGGGEQVKAEGLMNAAFRFRYRPGNPEGTAAVKSTLTGNGRTDMKKCEVKSSKITDGIALVTGMNELKNISFETVTFTFSVKDQKVFLDGIMNSRLVKMNPTGTLGFDERIDVITDLKLSPDLSARLPDSRVMGYMKDNDGWSIIPLKISGTVEKPSVGLNTAAMGKGLERGLKDEIGKRLFKGAQQKEGGQPSPPKEQKPQDLLKGLFGK